MHFVFDFGGVVFNWQPLQLLRTALPRAVSAVTPTAGG